MLLFISKYYLLLAKLLLLYGLLSILSLCFGQSLPTTGFNNFINKDYIRYLISSFVVYSTSYMIGLLIITNCYI